MFVVIELMLLVIAFLPLGILLYVFVELIDNNLIVFIGVNISVYCAGYLYTSKTYKILF